MCGACWALLGNEFFFSLLGAEVVGLKLSTGKKSPFEHSTQFPPLFFTAEITISPSTKSVWGAEDLVPTAHTQRFPRKKGRCDFWHCWVEVTARHRFSRKKSRGEKGKKIDGGKEVVQYSNDAPVGVPYVQ